MANQQHLDMLKTWASAQSDRKGVWSWWKRNHPNIEVDLTKADLSGANLKGVDLTRADLRDANLSGADLRGVDLEWADLTEADLRGVDLTKAVLKWAHLLKTDLFDADLSEADLSEANLSGADLSHAKLNRANLSQAYLSEVNLYHASLWQANLSKAYLFGARLYEANLYRAELSGANLLKADLSGASLFEADLSEANLSRANFYSADLRGADLRRARLYEANLSRVDLSRANMTGCFIYAISAWNVELKDTIQSGLIITTPGESDVTVDNLEVAQFIYLLLNNKKVRDVIDTITSKVVLILGRFTEQRKKVLDALRDELRKHNYLPVVYDFDQPDNRDVAETVFTLAHLARFVIADITEAKSVIQELGMIVPHLPSVPILPLLHISDREWGMYKHFQSYPWVLEVHRYCEVNDLLHSIPKYIIEPAEQKAQELAKR